MLGFLFKKTVILLFSLWCTATATFFLMHCIPGDPFIGEQNVPYEVLQSLYAHYGLDQPLLIQYIKYMQSLFRGDLGMSIVYPGRAVTQFIRDGFPISMTLGIQALLIAIPMGVLIGTCAAWNRSRWQDILFMLVVTLALSIPGFVLSSILQLLFSMKLHLFPVAKWGTWSHTVLPTLSLAAVPTACIARLIRSNMVEVLQQDYIQTAKAKGLRPFRITTRHALRNALLPTIGYLGPVTSQILTGSFMVERIFAIPGLGQWMIYSIHARDYPVILGLTLFFSTFLMLSVFCVDLLYAFVDPRIRKPLRAHA